jgi:hypothetical protein
MGKLVSLFRSSAAFGLGLAGLATIIMIVSACDLVGFFVSASGEVSGHHVTDCRCEDCMANQGERLPSW